MARTGIVKRFLSGFRSGGAAAPATRSLASNTQTTFKAAYVAAQQSRLTADWVMSALNSDSELRQALRPLRYRSRQLERNDDYVRGFLHQLTSNVIGPDGIGLKMEIKNSDGSLDKFANEQIEAAWRKWSRKGICTMDGRSAFKDVQKLFIRSVARDGENLVRMVRGNTANNEFGFAVQLLEADHLDEDDFRILNANRRIKMGVECDAWNRPTAYHLWKAHPADSYAYRARYDKERVPAKDLLHSLVEERAGQSRGVPWMVSAMMRLHMLGGYEEAELVASRVAASKMGFFEDPEGNARDLADDQVEDEAGNQEFVTEAKPGQFEVLPHGMQFKPWDPQHPSNAFNQFVKAMLRGSAASVAMSYPTFSGDLEGVNFSSIRQGVLTERESYRVLQRWTIDHLMLPVFEQWLVMAMTTGQISLPISKLEKFNAPKFMPRGWSWVDPLKDVNAGVAAINAGLDTRTEILAKQGRDFADVVTQLQREQDLLAEAGISIGAVNAALNSGDENEDDENANQNQD